MVHLTSYSPKNAKVYLQVCYLHTTHLGALNIMIPITNGTILYEISQKLYTKDE